MKKVITLSDRARQPDVLASTIKVAHLEITAFHSERNRELGVRP